MKKLTVEDVFVSAEGNPVFDSVDATEALGDVRAVSLPEGSKVVMIFVDDPDEETPTDYFVRPMVVTPGAILAPKVVEAYKHTPAFNKILEDLDPEVRFFPDKERSITVFAKLAIEALLRADMEIVEFCMGGISRLMEDTFVIGIYADFREDAETTATKVIVRIASLEMCTPK